MYSPSVRIGNWVEETRLADSKTAEYLKKKRHNQLFIQQTRSLICNLLREVTLSKTDDYVKFGCCVQLLAPDMPKSPQFEKCDNSDLGVVMAGSAHEFENYQGGKFIDGCAVVCTSLLTPCVKNTFVITPTDSRKRTNHNLRFGEEFMLQLTDSESEPLYVRSEIPLIDGVYGPSMHYPVRISNRRDRFSKWKVLYWDASKRLETEGAVIPVSTRVVINHTMTGQCLSVEATEWYSTFFGKECGISVHTYADQWRQETTECMWKFVTQDIESKK